MERALYNGIAVSTSLDGCHFFYSNPLHLRAGHDGSDEDSPSERLEWFSCACCPPNLARLVASLQHYVATADARGVQLHLHGPARIETRTRPGSRSGWRSPAPTRGTGGSRSRWRRPAASGRCRCGSRSGAKARASRSTASRWTRRPTSSATCTCAATGAGRAPSGWSCRCRSASCAPHPRIDAVRGCVALARGPLVYCIEQADHPGDVPVDDVRLDPAGAAAAGRRRRPASGVDVVLKGRASVRTDAPPALYTSAPATAAPQLRPAELTAIPYFRWGNRGPNAMRVWIPTV